MTAGSLARYAADTADILKNISMEMSMKKMLGQSFRETINKPELSAMMFDAGEISIDSFFEEGVWKSIPIFNWMVAAGKIYGNVRDYFFAKRMLAFLQSISSLSEKERQQLIHRLDADEKFGKYTGEQIIELLSRIDSERKAILVATALKFYAREEIDSLQLQRINYAIDRFILCDTDEFRSFCNDKKQKETNDGPVSSNFINAGLTRLGSGWDGGVMIYPNEIAHLFLRVIEEGLQ